MKTLGEITDAGAINICEAILKCATTDYIATYVHHAVAGRPSEITRGQIERFFKSDYFTLLTGGKIDPDACIRTCRERGEYERWRMIAGCKSCKRRMCVHKLDGGHYTAKRECEKRGELSDRNS